MNTGEVVFLYTDPDTDSYSDSDSDSDSDSGLNPPTSKKMMVPMPPFGCTVANVSKGYFPVMYTNDGDGNFISNSGNSVSLKDLRNEELYDFPGFRGVCGDTEVVYIFVAEKKLVTAGVEMKEGPGFLWDDEEARFTEEPQPTATSVWNSGLKRWDEACDIKGCGCGNLKSKMNWRTDGPSWIKADFFSSLFDHYCSEDCHCDCCGLYYNPETCAEKHAYPDEDAEVKRCSKPENANYSKYRY